MIHSTLQITNPANFSNNFSDFLDTRRKTVLSAAPQHAAKHP
jgi:hypothetical protein